MALELLRDVDTGLVFPREAPREVSYLATGDRSTTTLGAVITHRSYTRCLVSMRVNTLNSANLRVQAGLVDPEDSATIVPYELFVDFVGAAFFIWAPDALLSGGGGRGFIPGIPLPLPRQFQLVVNGDGSTDNYNMSLYLS